jgi:hypothetical protein
MMQTVNRREQWRQVLEAEIRRWETKSCDELISELKDEQVYQVDLDSKQFQVEAHLLENASEYIHVCVSVDDGSFPASLKPLSSSFIRKKKSSS